MKQLAKELIRQNERTSPDHTVLEACSIRLLPDSSLHQVSFLPGLFLIPIEINDDLVPKDGQQRQCHAQT